MEPSDSKWKKPPTATSALHVLQLVEDIGIYARVGTLIDLWGDFITENGTKEEVAELQAIRLRYEDPELQQKLREKPMSLIDRGHPIYCGIWLAFMQSAGVTY